MKNTAHLVLLQDVSELRRFQCMRRAVSSGTIAKAARDSAFERYAIVNGDCFRFDHNSLRRPSSGPFRYRSRSSMSRACACPL